MLRHDAQKHASDSVGYFDFGKDGGPNGLNYTNPYKGMMDHMQMHIGQNHPNNTGTVVKHRQLIDRCFYSNSLEEIMDNLRKETDPFAKKCLKAMEKNSYLSMKLALKMLRNA
jgi:hypothetical protein